MDKKIRVVAIGFASLCAFTTVQAADENLLQNGDFSVANQATDWSKSSPGGSFSWNSEDADGDANSGSLQVITTSSQAILTSSCFPVTPSTAFSYGGKTRAVTDGPMPLGPLIVCTVYAGSGCTGNSSFLGSGPNGPGVFMSTAMTWPATPASGGGGTGTLADDAQSVQCTLEVFENNTTVLFDDLFFNSTRATTPVRLQSFNVE